LAKPLSGTAKLEFELEKDGKELDEEKEPVEAVEVVVVVLGKEVLSKASNKELDVIAVGFGLLPTEAVSSSSSASDCTGVDGVVSTFVS